MDDLWKDFSLSSLHHHHHPTTARQRRAFQAIFPCPSTKNPPPPPTRDIHSHVCGLSHPQTWQIHHNVGGGTPTFINPFEAFVSSTSGFSSFTYITNASESDQRGQQRIKNRESADRSRARRQAYTNELEKQVASLLKENAKLKRQLKLASSVASAVQPPKKNTLRRTLTAPF